MEFFLGIFKALDPIKAITESIAKYKIAALTADTDEKKIAAQEHVKSLEARRDVLVAEGSKSSVNAIMRFLLAIGPAVYLAKIYIYDKVLGWGSTDPLSPELWYVTTAVIGFYFLSDAVRSFRK